MVCDNCGRCKNCDKCICSKCGDCNNLKYYCSFCNVSLCYDCSIPCDYLLDFSSFPRLVAYGLKGDGANHRLEETFDNLTLVSTYCPVIFCGSCRREKGSVCPKHYGMKSKEVIDQSNCYTIEEEKDYHQSTAISIGAESLDDVVVKEEEVLPHQDHDPVKCNII